MSLLVLLSFAACSKTKPNQVMIEKYCYDKIIETLQKKPLSKIEQSFFKDHRSHGILTMDQLSPSGYAEGASSATAANYVQEFSFIDRQSQTVKLIRGDKNGGIDVHGNNIVTPRIQCTVTWGLFKGQVMRDQLKVILVKLDKLKNKMRALDTIIEGSW